MVGDFNYKLFMVTVQILTDKIIIHSGMLQKDNLSHIQEDWKGNIDILQSIFIFCSFGPNWFDSKSISSIEIEITSQKSWLFLNWDYLEKFQNLKVIRVDNSFASKITWEKCKRVICQNITIPVLFSWVVDTLEIIWNWWNINISWQYDNDLNHDTDNRTIIRNLIIWSDNCEIEEIRLYNIEIRESFYIHHCKLKNLLVMNVLFVSKLNYIHDVTLDFCFIYKTQLTNLYTFNTLWNGIRNLEKDNTKDLLKWRVLENTYGEMKEYYRQLKFAHDEIWNKTEANKFFAKEMKYHMKVLEGSKDWKNYSIAWLQKETSDFGNDWIRAFIVYLVFVTFWFMCFQIYQLSQPDVMFDLSWHWFCKWMEEFTDLANPIPKVEDIKNIFSLLFSIFKILIVYQIVVALRRISQR